MQYLVQKFTSCGDAFTRGKIVPEPGNPVSLSLSAAPANCSMENANQGTIACPTGYYGSANSEFCFKIHMNKATNEESCR